MSGHINGGMSAESALHIAHNFSNAIERMKRKAAAEALREAAGRVMGPSDVLMDGATCRWIAMELRERAAHLEAE